MSATNRGIKRREYDFYATPEQTVRLMLDNVKVNGGAIDILEPSAGNGNVVSVVREYCSDANIDAYEIREEEYSNLVNAGADSVQICNFLDCESDKKYDLIIGNPPYSIAIDFIEKSLNMLKSDGRLIFLLRTNFLESKKRFEFWQSNQLSELLVLSKRPSFTGKGTDATSYSWFVWDKGCDKQIIKVI